MRGYRSGTKIGHLSRLRGANIEATIENGVVTTVATLEYAISGIGGEAFSARGDSGAMVSYNRSTRTGTEWVLIGMVFAGLEKENITYFTRADSLLDDIKEMTGAKDIKIFSSS